MTYLSQYRTSFPLMRLWKARAGLALAVALLSTIITSQWAQAQTFSTLYSFQVKNGAIPHGTLVQGTSGSFYGTTDTFGDYNAGTVFQITPGGVPWDLYNFCPPPTNDDCPGGGAPNGTLLQGTNGDFYGAATLGGADFFGAIFKITPKGTVTTLYSFYPPFGSSPNGGMIQASDGNLYGTTLSGGASAWGTVFRMTPSGTLTSLYSFCSQPGCSDGSAPAAGLLQGPDGNFYGTTRSGGANSSCVYGGNIGCGTVFRITPTGTLATVYNFCSQANCMDGELPLAALILGIDGNFYGTTSYAANNYGTVFKITPAGELTTLYSFCSQPECTDGIGPYAGLVQGTDGNFYGTTLGGGTNDYCSNGEFLGCGTIFSINPEGSLTTLYDFCPQVIGGFCTDGAYPNGLIQGTNGNFYGTTSGGGVNNLGTVFRVSVGLGPFVETLPIFGKIGTVIKIFGTDLTGTSAVSFNGTTSRFTMLSKSLIAATVPAGTTTGPVTVTTPSGMLTSNNNFHIKP